MIFVGWVSNWRDRRVRWVYINAKSVNATLKIQLKQRFFYFGDKFLKTSATQGRLSALDTHFRSCFARFA
jgi:hypothetical protein